MGVNPEGRALLALATAARETSDWARGVVQDIATPMRPGERIRQVRRLRAMTMTALDRVVIAELLAGASWDEVAAALGRSVSDARRIYEETLDLWLVEGTSDFDATILGDFTTGARHDSDPEGTARAHDSWLARHAEPWDALDEPVTKALRAH